VQLDERADLTGFGHRRAAEPGLVEEVAVAARGQAGEELLPAGRDRGGEEVDDATGGVRAVASPGSSLSGIRCLPCGRTSASSRR
jgi:hypothetical protein